MSSLLDTTDIIERYATKLMTLIQKNITKESLTASTVKIHVLDLSYRTRVEKRILYIMTSLRTARLLAR